MAAREAGFLLNIPIDRIALPAAAQEALRAVEGKRLPVIFACANPHSLVVAQRDPSFHSALTRANLVVADGVGVSIMARLLGVTIGPRITGSDYFFAVLNILQQRGRGRVFFFGSSQRVLDRIASRFATDFPSLTLCGTLSPPFGSWNDEENRRMVQIIRDAKPDVLWVGMTAPKQEKWVEANRGLVNTPVIGSIGAVFDFYAGTYARAPEWICRVGLEWAYRFVLEPKRMWQRNAVSAPTFVWLVLRQHLLGRVPGR
ncbi:MAG: WecB/TagA/CpsF family glycosyltransferase [Nitrospirota bacterium]|nr:WecB/TagA/CpsF family glycosyltransferase [Nitrospirota bacterium]MDP2381385.1 WecB/TagA/CpsF family glycosyltransferase [Nitrospirota bacterium]